MVGLQNRAGRCTLCKRRKIKCDLSRPSCSRCTHLNAKCEYPPQNIGIFINRTLENPFLNADGVIFKPSKNTRLSVSKNLTVSTFGSAHPRHHEQKVQTITWKSPDPAPEFLMQATSTFINLYLPASAQGPTPSGQSPASWVYVLPNFTHQNSAYKKCLTALCVAQLGTWNHDSVLEHESTRLYASALAELRTTIQSGKIKDPEATLASVVMLCTYETFVGSSESDHAWASHVRGGSKILQLLGPRIHESPIGRQFFFRIRTICILEALRTRNAAVLEGLNLPHGCAKGIQNPDLFHRLQDLMIKLPPIMEAFDSLDASQPSHTNKSTTRQSLIAMLQTCSNLNAALLSWFEDMKTKFPVELYWSVPAAAHNPADDTPHGKVFPIAFEFAKLSVAQLILLHWSTLLLLYRLILDIHQKLEPHAIEETTTEQRYGTFWASLPHQYPAISKDTIAKISQNICQSIEHCYNRKNGTLGVQSTVFPLWFVEDWYASQPDRWRELAWCEGVGGMTAKDSRFDLRVTRFRKGLNEK